MDKIAQQLIQEQAEIKAKYPPSYYPYLGQIVSFCKYPDKPEENFYRGEVKEIIRQGSKGILPIVKLEITGQWIWGHAYEPEDPYEVIALMHRNHIYHVKP